MNKVFKIASALLLSVWLVGMYRAKFGQDILTHASPDLLMLGTDAKQYPYTFEEQGHIVGFDVDLFSAIATRIGKKRIIKKISPDQLIPQLSDDMVHTIIQETEIQEGIGELALQEKQKLMFDTAAFLSSHPYLESSIEYDAEKQAHQNDSRTIQHFFVVSKNNEALLTLLNNALDEIKEDGTLVTLQKKWNLIS